MKITLTDKEGIFTPIVLLDIRSYSKTFLHRLKSEGRNKANRLLVNGTSLAWKIEQLGITAYVSEIDKLRLEGLKVRQDQRITQFLQKISNVTLTDEYERLPFEPTLSRTIVAGSQIADDRGNVSGFPVYNVFINSVNTKEYIGMNLSLNQRFFEVEISVTEE